MKGLIKGNPFQVTELDSPDHILSCDKKGLLFIFTGCLNTTVKGD
jgi:hypothetical protein